MVRETTKAEIMAYCYEEIDRGLRLFGWANDNNICINHWINEFGLNEVDVEKLRAYNKAESKRPEYQF